MAERKKILIAYYSLFGNTAQLAEKIKLQTGGEMFVIETANPYPKVYDEVVEQVKLEKAKDFRPELKQKPLNISDYDIIFLGTPVWWFTLAPAVKSFISQNDMRGKVIAPFCTEGGGGADQTFKDMRNLIGKAKFLEGLEIYGKVDDSTDLKVAEWLDKLGLNENE